MFYYIKYRYPEALLPSQGLRRPLENSGRSAEAKFTLSFIEGAHRLGRRRDIKKDKTP